MRPVQLLIPLFLISLGSCANEDGGGPLGIVAFSSKQHVAAAEPLFGNKEDRCLSRPAFLISLQYPESPSNPSENSSKPYCDELKKTLQGYLKGTDGSTTAGSSSATAPNPASPTGNTGVLPATITTTSGAQPADTTTATGNQSPTALSLEAKRRNVFIDAMTSASERKCQRYIAFLKTYDGNVNNTFGIAAILTAAVVPVAGPAAGALGAASAFSEGTRATINSNNFANQSVQVISTAFQKARQARLDELQNLKQCPIEQYSVQKAIGDVYAYHGTCSLTAGLAETALAVQRSNTFDLDTIKTMLASLAAVSAQAANLNKPPANGTADTVAGAGSGTTGTGTGSTAGAGAAGTAQTPTGTSPGTAAGSTPVSTASGQVGASHILACPFSFAPATAAASKS